MNLCISCHSGSFFCVSSTVLSSNSFGLHFQLFKPISPGLFDELLVQDHVGWLAMLLSLSGREDRKWSSA